MSNSTPKAPSVPTKLYSLTRFNIFVSAFAVNFAFNALLVLFVFPFGVSTGYEGSPTFSWEQAEIGATYLFGGVVPLLVALFLLIVVVATLWLVRWLSVHQHGWWSIVIVVAAFITGGLLWSSIKPAELASGLWPFAFLVAFTLVESLVEVAAAPFFTKMMSRQRGTNH